MKTKFVVAAAALLVGVIGVAVASGEGAKVVRSSGDLTVYANPYANGTANPISGGEASVHSVTTPSGKTIVTLHVSGLPANRSFGSHVHKLGCNDNKAGGHYQNVPAVPPTSVNDPSVANPENEVWLDFTTNAAGNGEGHAEVDFAFRPDGANAVVIHDHGTEAGGIAGAKLACLDVNF